MHPLPLTLLLTLAPATQAQRTLPELENLFALKCAACHGPDGSAFSPEGFRLKGLNFTSVEDMKGRTDAELVAAIRKGLFFGLKMPAFKDELSDEEIKILVRDILRKARKGKTIGHAEGR
jgi:mono/diheme cytochrome c family protein